MRFLVDNKKKFNTLITLSYTVEAIIGIVINLVSQTPFVWHSTRNLFLIAILIILVLIQIVCNIMINTYNNQIVPRKLKKAFSESGGYDVAAKEMQHCIQNGDLRKFKDIKKMITMIER